MEEDIKKKTEGTTTESKVEVLPEVTVSVVGDKSEAESCKGEKQNSKRSAEKKDEKVAITTKDENILSCDSENKAEEKEKASKPDVLDVFMQTNVTLQGLCNSYSKVYNSFKGSKLTIEKQKAEIRTLKADAKELNEMYEASREREKSSLNKSLYLENKNAEYIEIIKDKSNLIAERDSAIESLHKELLGRDEMIEVMNKDGSKQVNEMKVRLASVLNQDYHDYLECKDGEMTEEFGELFRIQLGNIFNLLKKEGIPLE